MNPQSPTMPQPQAMPQSGMANAGTPIQMTREQYQATYGQAPQLPQTPQAPIQMTREEYQAKYGQAPQTPQDKLTQGLKNLPGISGYMNAGSSNFLGNYVGGIKDAFGNVVKDVTSNPQGGSQVSTPGQALESGTKTAADITNAVLSPITGVLNPVLQPIVQGLSDTAMKNPVYQKAINGLNDVVTKYPQTAGIAGNLFQTFLNVAGIEAGRGSIKDATPSGQPQYVGKTSFPEDVIAKEQAKNTEPPVSEADINQARQSVADAYKSSMPLTPLEQSREAGLLNAKGDNVYTTLAKYNISPASEDAIPQLEHLSSQFETAADTAKANESAYFNLNEIQSNARQSILDNITSATERQTALNKLNDEINSLKDEEQANIIKNAKGQEIAKAPVVERLRKTGNDWLYQGKNKFNPDTIKGAVGKALGDAVRDQVEKEGTFPAYRELNREWSKVIHAQQVLEDIKAKGKTFKQIGGMTGTVARRVVSGIAGLHSGGIGGAIIAELGSETIFKILSNPDLRTYFDRKILSESGKATPEAIKKLSSEIDAHIKEVESRPRLPEGSPLGSTNNPRQMGSETMKGSFQTVPAKAISIKNPKTGKFERAYTSEAKGYLNSQKQTAATNPPSIKDQPSGVVTKSKPTITQNNIRKNVIQSNSTTKLKGKQGGYVNPGQMAEDIVSGVSKTIRAALHPEDIKFLKQTLNYYRGAGELSDKEFNRSYDMLVKMGINMDTSKAKIASQVEKFLSGSKVPSFLDARVKSVSSDHLLQEAKKYKTPEEFVKAKKLLLHGSNSKTEIAKFDSNRFGKGGGKNRYGKGVYLTNNEELAKRFAEDGGSITKAIPGTSNILDVITEVKDIVSKLEKEGYSRSVATENADKIIKNKYTLSKYDGIRFPSIDQSAIQTIIFNPNKVYTKSQLIDIWNKAHNKK